MSKTINPSDSDLEAFFKKNAARYAKAVPEERKITYFAFTPTRFPAEFRSLVSRRFSSITTSTRANTRRRSRPNRGTF